MKLPSPTRATACIAAVALLTSCLHLQLGGPVVEATLTLSPLRQPGTVIETLTTPSEAKVRQQLGADSYDNLPDTSKMAWLGNVEANTDLYEADSLYLATASGGLDYDADTNLDIDGNPAPVIGRWHAILDGSSQVGTANVSVLTEAIYRTLELQLDVLTNPEIRKGLDKAAVQTVIDINNSGNIDYLDVLSWVSHINPDAYIRDLALVDQLGAAIRANAPAADIRALSRAVLGLPNEAEGPFQLSGTVSVSPLNQVDSDVNDSNADFIDNSSLENAQAISVPVVVGGYLNEPGTGTPGRSQEPGDVDDYFRVDLLQDQLITLEMAEDPLLTDIDLLLYNAGGNLVDASLGIEQIERLQVPSNGSYTVRVKMVDSYTNYRLTIGRAQLGAVPYAPRLSDDFVPGEIVTLFDETRAVANGNSGRRRVAGMQVHGEPGRANLLTFQRQFAAASTQQDRKLQTLLEVKRLRRLKEVIAAEPNYYVYTAAESNDPLYDTQSWHYEQINLPGAWENSLGAGVIVAVVDSGIRPEHPDLQGQLVAGYDFISSTQLSGDGDGLDSDPTDTGDGGVGIFSSTFHGTHVAGTVAAASNNLTGGAGVAPDARIMALRALGGTGTGYSYDVLQAVRYAAGLTNDSRQLPPKSADIINLSLGGPFSPIAERLYQEVAEKGIITVAAAGNDSTDTLSYPAGYESVLSVSATNIRRELANYSNFGSTIALAAPGGDSTTGDRNADGVSDMVLSTAADDTGRFIEPTYTLLQGTSMACPHVAGVLALMKSVYPSLSFEDVNSLLQSGDITDDIGDTGRDNLFGWGLINANKAVLTGIALESGTDIDDLPTLYTNPGTLNFGAITDILALTVENGGTGELVVDSVISRDPWLFVAPAEIDGNGLGTYSVRLRRNRLVEGQIKGSIDVSTNAGSRQVQVFAREAALGEDTNGNAGYHYILLVNADTGEIVQQNSRSVSEGQYPFQFSDVPAGRYQIIAGSDLDDNFQICDVGEACGAWPVFDGPPAVLDLDSDHSDLDFSTTFSIGLFSQRSNGSVQSGQARSGYRARQE